MKKKQDNQKEIEKFLLKREKEFINLYNISLVKIQDLFIKYSAIDILNSLFVISLWIKNVSSPVKLQFAYMIFASLEESKYQPDDTIKNYVDFAEFSSKLIEILPEFFMLEDYIPEADWGEIKYHHNRKNYKMFYGTHFDGIYEYLEAFNLLHCTINDFYISTLKRSPVIELEKVLKIQHTLIETIKQDVTDDIASFKLGHIEAPPENFWKSCFLYYNDISEYLPQELLNYYSCKIGEISSECLEVNRFINDAHEDEDFRWMFINVNGKFYPILPRRFVPLIIITWGKLYNDNREKLIAFDPNIHIRLSYHIYQYIKNRTSPQNLFPIISPFDANKKKPSVNIYSCAFTTKGELNLFYILDPSYSAKEIENNLLECASFIKKDIKILNKTPQALLLHFEKENNVVAFQSKDIKEKKLLPKIIVIIPRLSFSMEMFEIPKELSGNILTLEDFLGIIDEINELDILKSFFEFMNNSENGKHVLNSAIDMYGVFKDTFGIVYPGANQPSSISLMPGWGSGYRYNSLKEFWSKYPEIDFVDHPRSWEIMDMGKNKVRLVSKNTKTSVLPAKVGNLNIFINAPYAHLNEKEFRVTDLLTQILQDSFTIFNEILLKNINPYPYEKLHIFIFPYTLAKNNQKFSYLKHLNSFKNNFDIELGFAEDSVPAVRISFKLDNVFEVLKNSTSRKFEINFFLDLLNSLINVIQINIDKIFPIVEKETQGLPRHKFNLFKKLASFPEHTREVKPDSYDFKLAKKIIANIAFQMEIKPGEYSVDEAKVILNKLKGALVKVINQKVSLYNYEKSIGYIISKADVLTDNYEVNKLVYKESKKHAVDYLREEKYAENHKRYTHEHRNYRYLIEKFVELSPNNNTKINEEGLKELLAIVDWLHVIQHASDIIHYGIAAGGIIVNDDFLVDVKYYEDVIVMEKKYGEESASVDLGLIGNKNDRLRSTKNFSEFLDKLDQACILDLGFSLRNLTTVLDLLTHWAAHANLEKESEFYSSNIDELYNVTLSALLEGTFDKNEFIKIINFLTLSQDKILTVLGQEQLCDDLPIWEYNKRPMRYNLKPLIEIKGKYYWGPYSARKTNEIWVGNASSAMFPFEIQSENIRRVLDTERENISKALNTKAEEIVSRYTEYYEKNCELHKKDKSKNFPLSLGDYDVLAYLEKKNIILNIECKDLEPPFCPKDTKRLRERIFGRTKNDKGYLEKVINREVFFKQNIHKILETLKWPLNSIDYKVITIFLMQRTYWWTKFPPFESDIVFLQIDLLDDYLKSILVVNNV